MRGRLSGVVDHVQLTRCPWKERTGQPKPCVRQWTSAYLFSSDGSVGQPEAGNRWTSKGQT